jgi:hypothetical protein
MPIRIRCRNKWPHEAQVTQIAGIIVCFEREATASYAGRKSELRILCASA